MSSVRGLAPRLLVVEDDPAVARSVLRFLRLHGLSARVERSVRAAASLEGPFAAVVLEVELADGDGVELARQLVSRGSAECAVFYTAANDAGRLQSARAVGRVCQKRSAVPALLSTLLEELLPTPSVRDAVAPAPALTISA